MALCRFCCMFHLQCKHIAKWLKTVSALKTSPLAVVAPGTREGESVESKIFLLRGEWNES